MEKELTGRKIFTFVIIWMFSFIFSSGSVKAQRYVTIFYACWANECLNTTYGEDVYIMGVTPYSPYPEWNWWGKPYYAATTGDGTIKNNYRMYFDSPDSPNNDLIDWHAELLVSAGIDYITLDLTNGTQTKIVNGAKAICKRYGERYNQGLPSPKIVFWVQDSVCLQKVETEIFEVYREEIFFEYLGKKLVNVAGGNVQPAIPVEGIFGRYTCRRMWGLNNSGSFWQFKVNSAIPPAPFYYNGEPEQMCAPVATQATVMTNDGIYPAPGAVGRENGAYFIKYMDAAISAGVKFLFIHSWNEWTAQNLGAQAGPMFVDQWKSEYSSDIEPVSGSHGWDYYDLMCEKIAEFKNASGFRNENILSSPNLFKVEESYPNPFNVSTILNYYLQEMGTVKISVFNSLGQLISYEGKNNIVSGDYSYIFNASGYPSGVYFVNINFLGQSGYCNSVTKKLVFLK